jgi:hypothetical protein
MSSFTINPLVRRYNITFTAEKNNELTKLDRMNWKKELVRRSGHRKGLYHGRTTYKSTDKYPCPEKETNPGIHLAAA